MSEYDPQRGRTDRVPSQPHRVAPVAVESPAAISSVQEIAWIVAEQMLARSRPLKLSVAGLGALVVATCGWGASQVSTWQDAQKNQWKIEAKQLEQDEAMAGHLLEPHVSPEQIEALEARLTSIEEKLDKALKSTSKVEEPVKLKVPSRR